MTMPSHAMPWVSVNFWPKINITVLNQLSYPPDLAPCDFFLFPKLKEVIKGTHVEDVEAIKKAVTKELRAMLQESHQESMEAWQKRMAKFIKAEGDYFEGEKL